MRLKFGFCGRSEISFLIVCTINPRVSVGNSAVMAAGGIYFLMVLLQEAFSRLGQVVAHSAGHMGAQSSVQCAVCSVRCAVYSVQCAVHGVQCVVWGVQCVVCSA